MKIKKGQLLRIMSRRKGAYVAVALDDFDSEDEGFWPVALAEGYARGISMSWNAEDEIPCRGSLVKSIEVLGE